MKDTVNARAALAPHIIEAGVPGLLGWASDWQERWQGWQWQQRSAVRTAKQITTLFPQVPLEELEALLERQKLLVTPYYLEECLEKRWRCYARSGQITLSGTILASQYRKY